MDQPWLSAANIERASATIDPVFLHSPQFVSEPLSDLLGTQVLLKIETVNPIRSFKGRGASLFVAGLPADARLICASAGNFGQAMAFACRARGIALRVVASVNANPFKIERMRQLGAEVMLTGADFDAAKTAAKAMAETSGETMVEDGLVATIAEGAGTIGVELLASATPPDVVLVPLGNGALLGGVARYLKARAPATKIIAVQAAGAPAMVESWRAKQLVRHAAIATIADGIGVREPIAETQADLNDLIDDAVLVSEEEIIQAMRFLHQHTGLVVEPSGAVGVAALQRTPALAGGGLAATILTGGNLTHAQMRTWLFA